MTFLQVWDTMVRVYLKWEKIIKTKEEENMENKKAFGHALAIFTIFIWGTTFISTKILLQAFQPVEILSFRFVLWFILLLIMNTHRLPF